MGGANEPPLFSFLSSESFATRALLYLLSPLPYSQTDATCESPLLPGHCRDTGTMTMIRCDNDNDVMMVVVMMITMMMIMKIVKIMAEMRNCTAKLPPPTSCGKPGWP